MSKIRLQIKRSKINNNMILSIKFGRLNFTGVLSPDEFIDFLHGADLIIDGSIPTKLIEIDDSLFIGDYVKLGPRLLKMD